MDYYIGVCNIGVGVVLLIVIVVIGYNKSCIIVKLGIKVKDEYIVKMIVEGKVVFGFFVEYVEYVILMLINYLK